MRWRYTIFPVVAVAPLPPRPSMRDAPFRDALPRAPEGPVSSCFEMACRCASVRLCSESTVPVAGSSTATAPGYLSAPFRTCTARQHAAHTARGLHSMRAGRVRAGVVAGCEGAQGAQGAGRVRALAAVQLVQAR